jgi:hypothetical protein
MADVAEADTVLSTRRADQPTCHHFAKLGKNVIFFIRHKSGPVSLWYEIVSQTAPPPVPTNG